jgi:hypothetical protein
MANELACWGLRMELAGLEPATSWVRSKLALGGSGGRKSKLAGDLRPGRAAAPARMCADIRGFPWIQALVAISALFNGPIRDPQAEAADDYVAKPS